MNGAYLRVLQASLWVAYGRLLARLCCVSLTDASHQRFFSRLTKRTVPTTRMTVNMAQMTEVEEEAGKDDSVVFVGKAEVQGVAGEVAVVVLFAPFGLSRVKNSPGSTEN